MAAMMEDTMGPKHHARHHAADLRFALLKNPFPCHYL